MLPCVRRRAFLSSRSSVKKRLEVMYYKAILFSFQGLYKRPTHCFIRVDPKQLLGSFWLRPLFTKFEHHTGSEIYVSIKFLDRFTGFH